MQSAKRAAMAAAAVAAAAAAQLEGSSAAGFAGAPMFSGASVASVAGGASYAYSDSRLGARWSSGEVREPRVRVITLQPDPSLVPRTHTRTRTLCLGRPPARPCEAIWTL